MKQTRLYSNDNKILEQRQISYPDHSLVKITIENMMLNKDKRESRRKENLTCKSFKKIQIHSRKIKRRNWKTFPRVLNTESI